MRPIDSQDTYVQPLRIYATPSSGSVKLVATASAASPSRVVGQARLTGFAPGQHVAFTLTYQTSRTGSHSETVGGIDLDPGGAIFGTLLYDESLANLPIKPRSVGVVIPEKMSLSLKQTEVAGSVWLLPCAGSLTLIGVRADGIQPSVPEATIGEMTIRDCVIGHSVIGPWFGAVSATGDVTVENSFFWRTMMLTAGRTLNVQSSDFYESYVGQGGASLSAPMSGFGVKNCVFVNQAGFSVSGLTPGVLPGVTGNSFLSGIVLGSDGGPAPAGVTLPGNYWGGALGPRTHPQRWLDGQGESAGVENPTFSFLSSGSERVSTPDVAIPPSPIILWGGIWGRKVLQNVSSDLIRKGRDILVAVDARTKYGTRDAASLRLKIGSELIAPSQPGIVQRDYGLPTADPGNHNRTVNFIIPARDEHIFQYEILETAPPGGGEPVQLAIDQIVQYERPERPLRIAVLPLAIDGYAQNFLPGQTGSRAATALKRQLSAMLPLRSDEIEIDVLADARYKLGYSALYVLTSRGYMLNECSAVLRGHLTTLNASRTRPYDFLVAVVPKGTLGAEALGASLAFRREVILVDEISPESAIHEMGHALGLYTTIEQYRVLWDGYDDSGTYYQRDYGARVEDCTAFVPSDSPSAAPIYGRIRHFPFGVDSHVWDVMGGDGIQWIMPKTHLDLGGALLSMLSVPDPAPLEQKRERAAAGFRRVVLEGLQSPEMSAFGHYPLLRESIHCGPAPAEMGEIQQGWPAGHEFVAYDAAGLRVASATCQRSQQGGMLQPWVQTFDVPEEAVRYEIRDLWTREIIFIQKPVALPTPVLQPPALSADGSRVTLAWTLGAGLPSGRPLDVALSVSEDGAASWRHLGSYDEVSEVALPRDGFGSGALRFRIVVSDGLARTESVTAPWQPPPLMASTLILLQPWDGARAPIGTAWSFDAAFDTDWPGQSLSWSSSRDGALGTGPSLSGVVLTPGIHVLTAAIQAPGRSPRQRQLTVLVADLTAIDLALGADALSFSAAGLDPIQGNVAQPLLGRRCEVRVRVRNPGRRHTARLQIFLAAPHEAETLLSDTTFPWNPLAQREQVAEFVPTRSGTHRVRAVLSTSGSDGIIDTDPLNNEQTWTILNQPPEARGYTGTTREGQSLAIELMAEDPDLDAATIAIVTPPVHGTLAGVPTALRYQPHAGFTGIDQFTFRASDAFGTGRTATATLRVVPTPPVFLGSLVATGEQYHPFSYTAQVGGSSPELSVALPPPLSALTFAPASRTVAGTVSVTGTYGLGFAVENPVGRVEPNVQVTFSPNNDPPSLTSARVVEGTVEEPISYLATGSFFPSVIEYADLPQGVFAMPSGALVGSPKKSGAFTVRVGLTNAAGSAWETITLRIASSRLPPEVPAQSVFGRIGTPLSWPLQAFHEPTRFHIDPLPVGLVLDSTTGVITGVPEQAGPFLASLEASNLYGADAELVWINIDAPAGYPVLTDPGSIVLNGGLAADVLLSASGGPASFAATGLPAGLALHPTTGRLTGVPTEWGEFSPIVRVTNASGTTAVRLRLTVTPGNGMPVMTHAVVINGLLGGTVDFQLAGTNAPVFSVRGLPDGLSYDPAIRRITGVWRVAGMRFIEITASNAKGQTTQRLMLQSSATYAGWLSLHSLTGTAALATADPDLDGAANLTEYMANSNPRSPGSRPLFTINPEGRWGTLRFRCRRADTGTLNAGFQAGGVQGALERSTASTPLVWAPDSNRFAMGTTVDNGDGTVDIALPLLGGSEAVDLFRLRTILP